MRIDRLAIVGVGLIGGSIGLAAKRRGIAGHVVGIEPRQDSLEAAQRRGAIDEPAFDVKTGVAGADLIVVCTPVQRIVEQVLEAAKHCLPVAILTDTGSTKEKIVAELESQLPASANFVGGHPLAGSEKRGVEHADAELFVNRLTVLTPTAKTKPAAAHRVVEFWYAIGARVDALPPKHHDVALALTSHAPHLLAAAMAGSLPEVVFEFAAAGLRDTTRIAAGDPELWTGIFQHNREALLEALDCIMGRIDHFRSALKAGDGARISHLLQQGKKVRDELGN